MFPDQRVFWNTGGMTPSPSSFVTPPPAKEGDRIAIVSPSWAGPGVFPEVHEESLRVLRDQLGVEPVEYPTTRRVGASAEERARDLTTAWADPTIAAVMASIGGDDQLTVLAHLDPDVFRTTPKRFFGYSDNTNFLNYLWNLGIVGFHGGSTMVHLARAGGMNPVSINSLRAALFTNDTVELAPLREFTDLSPDWRDPLTLREPLTQFDDPGWYWHNAYESVTGPTWGGNLEILHWNLAANRWILEPERYCGCVLLLETSEEMPSAEGVYQMLRNFGERGLLSQFPAVVVAKAKAWTHSNQLDETARARFRVEQREAVLTAFTQYNPSAVVVVGPDFGHTDPQYVVPYGGLMTVDGRSQKITMTY